jgi:hypothetical protein
LTRSTAREPTINEISGSGPLAGPCRGSSTGWRSEDRERNNWTLVRFDIQICFFAPNFAYTCVRVIYTTVQSCRVQEARERQLPDGGGSKCQPSRQVAASGETGLDRPESRLGGSGVRKRRHSGSLTLSLFPPAAAHPLASFSGQTSPPTSAFPARHTNPRHMHLTLTFARSTPPSIPLSSTRPPQSQLERWRPARETSQAW